MDTPTKAADELRLISPYDDAVDLEATGKEAFKEYLNGDCPNADTLVTTGEPTVYTVRPLTKREFGLCRSLAESIIETGETNDKGEALYSRAYNRVEVAYQRLRWALTGIEGVELKRQRLYSANVLTLASVEGIDEDDALWLSRVVGGWSALSEEKKRTST